jgi:biopolymer transport protein ExbD
MRVRNTGKHEDKIELQMTPMIDIVFQLLIFFIMTFKIVTIEGDFNIRMPLASQQVSSDLPPLPPVRVRLTSGADGQLTGIGMGERQLASFQELHNEVLRLTGGGTGPSATGGELEVELDADYNLNYNYVIQAITAVSGRVDETGRIIPLIEKIRFAPPRGGPE